LSNKQNFRRPPETAFICRDGGVSQLGKIDSRYSDLEVHVVESPFVEASCARQMSNPLKLQSLQSTVRYWQDGHLISFAGTPISDGLAMSVLSRSRFASIDRRGKHHDFDTSVAL
jgi:hypothetical protein